MNNDIKEILDYFRMYMSDKDCIKLDKIENYMINLRDQIDALITLKDKLQEENKNLRNRKAFIKVLLNDILVILEGEDME